MGNDSRPRVRGLRETCPDCGGAASYEGQGLDDGETVWCRSCGWEEEVVADNKLLEVATDAAEEIAKRLILAELGFSEADRIAGMISDILSGDSEIRGKKSPALRWFQLRGGRYEEEDRKTSKLVVRLTRELCNGGYVDMAVDQGDLFEKIIEVLEDHESTR